MQLILTVLLQRYLGVCSLQQAGGLPTLPRVLQKEGREMKQPTGNFADAVRRAWSNPERVADVGIKEMWSHVEEQDHDDQVEMAKRIGVIARKTADKDPEAFVEGYPTRMNEFTVKQTR